MDTLKTTIVAVTITLIAFTAHQSQAQNAEPIREGFTVGGYIGIGAINFTEGIPDGEEKTQGNLMLPNIKVGFFLSENLAVYLATTGHLYKLNGHERSLAGITPTVQYWAGKFWVGAGYGPAADFRAIYQRKENAETTHCGMGGLLNAGYEVIQREKWALDIQTRLLLASVNLPDDQKRTGSSVTFT